MAGEESSIADLLRQLVADGNYLVRTEIRLAKAEVRDNIAAAAKGGAGIGLGAMLLLGAVLTLLGAAVAFLAPVVGTGWAAVIVGGLAFAVGGGLIAGGVNRLKGSSMVPDRALSSVKCDAETIGGSVG
jgi:hypothetical protein